MIKTKTDLWSCRLPLEVIFIGIILLFFIIQILLTDHDHWLFYIIQIPAWFPSFSLGDTDLLGNDPMVLDDMVNFLDLLQKTYWLQTQVKNLVVQKKINVLLAGEVLNFIPKTPRSGIGRTLKLPGYSSGLT